VADPKYAHSRHSTPFFDIVQQGLPAWSTATTIRRHRRRRGVRLSNSFPRVAPQTSRRDALMALYASYGDKHRSSTALTSLVVHRSQDPRVVIIEYDVHGKIVATGSPYDNRFISVVTIEGRKIVQWRDYMDSLAAMTALSQAAVVNVEGVWCRTRRLIALRGARRPHLRSNSRLQPRSAPRH